MKAWKIAIIVTVVAVIALFWRGLHMDPRSIPTVLEGKPAVTFAAQEISTGNIWTLEELRGKVVVLNFWASWCSECRAEHENLLHVQEQGFRHAGCGLSGPG
jgi:cytochrome c biogenesis protein CcmG/thiol:disulfide interchange protein DsbE